MVTQRGKAAAVLLSVDVYERSEREREIREAAQFYERVEDGYREISESRFFPGLKPELLAEALEQSKIEGQTAALEAFRQRLRKS